MISRRVVIVGIPGVGKSTVVAKVVELLGEKGLSTKVVNYGSVMMQQATKLYNVSSRDEMRKLSVETQRNLQVYAAAEISKLADQVVIVDTHLFISTSEGFWPGMPMDVLQALKPTNLVLVVAKPEEIMERRKNDTTRSRDTATRESLVSELGAAISLLFASSLVMGCPALVVDNPEGPVEQAASKIIAAISS
ncbi:MAG: adenylate kinase [Nitrososphaerales archaeon]